MALYPIHDQRDRLAGLDNISTPFQSLLVTSLEASSVVLGSFRGRLRAPIQYIKMPILKK